jgi:uncharacterized repeat protein (TIGR03803 family)
VGTSTYHATQTTQTVAATTGSTSTAIVDYYNIVPNTTKVLDQAGAQGLTVSSDGSTLTISSSSAVAQSLRPGDVLVSAPIAGAPNGFLVKVTATTSSGSSIVVTSTPATLADEVTQAHFGVDIPFVLPNGSPAVQKHAGYAIRTGSLATPQVGSLSNPCAAAAQALSLPFSYSLAPDQNQNTLTASGELDFCNLHVDYDIRPLSLNAQMTVSLQQYSDMTVQGQYSTTIDLNEPLDLSALESQVVCLGNETCQAVQGLPDSVGNALQVVAPSITPFVGMTGAASGGLYLGGEESGSFQAGAQIQGVTASPILGGTLQQQSYPTAVDGTLDVKGYFGVTLAFQLLGSVTAHVDPRAYAELKADTAANPWWTLSLGDEADAGMTLSFLGFGSSEHDTPEYTIYSSQLAQAGGAYAGQPSLKSITPNTAVQYNSSTPISLVGLNFVPGCYVTFNGSPLPTTYTDPTSLSAVVPASDLNSVGTFQVAVVNSQATGTTSNSLPFTVTANPNNPPGSKVGTIFTVAGNSSSGFSGDGGLAANAQLNAPWGVTADSFGNLYIADTDNHVIRKIDTIGMISTVAGQAGNSTFGGDGGPATVAQLEDPISVVTDAAGNLYIAEQTVDSTGAFVNGARIRKVDNTGTITTIAGGATSICSTATDSLGDGCSATSAILLGAWGLAIDSKNNIYVSDYFGNRVRQIGTNGIITTVAGNGTKGYSGDGKSATNAELYGPAGLSVDASDNIYLADSQNNVVRKLTSTGIITTVAGNGAFAYSGDGGLATDAGIDFPFGPMTDPAGNLFISELGGSGSAVREVNNAGNIETVAGNSNAGYGGDGGPATSATLAFPHGIALDTSGDLFIADTVNNRIREVLTAAAPTNVGVQCAVPSHAPAGEIIGYFPKSLILDSTFQVTNSYDIYYSESPVLVQATAEFSTSESPQAVFNAYKSLLVSAGWTITNSTASGTLYGIYADKGGFSVNMLAIPATSSGSSVDVTVLLPVNGLSCSGSSTITSVSVVCSPSSIQTSETSTCTPTVTGTGTFSSTVTWSVSPSTIGTVSSGGVFTPSSTGTATITATASQDTSKFGSATVTVSSAPSTVTGVSVTCSPSSIQANQASTCTPTVTGTGSYSSAVSWAVSPTSIGTVSSSGVFTPTTTGTATITATSTQNTSKSGSATVAVISSSTITGVTVTCTPSSIQTNQTSACTPTVSGTGSYSTTVTWSVNPSTIGTVSSGGVFTPAATGTATVIATSTQDTSKSGSASVAVNAMPTVEIFPTSVTVPTGAIQTFVAAVQGGGGVIWSVKEGTGGSISQLGIYTAPVAAGTYHVVATSSANSAQSASATVTVIPGGTFTLLDSFSSAFVTAGLVQGTDGNFYGTNEMQAFRMNSSGVGTFIASLESGPRAPISTLIQASDGNFYGVDSYAGSIFRLTSSGTVTTVYSFPDAQGSGLYPWAGLVQANDGNLYGTTYAGGDLNCNSNGFGVPAYGPFGYVGIQSDGYMGMGCGTVFRMDPSGNVTILHSFEGQNDGNYPQAPLIQGTDGSFYGTASGGGSYQDGTVFKIDGTGNVQLLHEFSGSDGNGPVAALVQGSDGNLYGTTAMGGANDDGVVFRIDTSGSNFTVLHSFSGQDGDNPVAPLVQGSDGNFYGTTWDGGDQNCGIYYFNVGSESPYIRNAGCGTVFRMDASGNVTVLHAFEEPQTPDGNAPYAGVIFGSDGYLYGTTYYGGANVYFGTVFKLGLPGH